MSHTTHVPSHKPHDKQFYDTLTLVMGILIAIVMVLVFVCRVISADTQNANVADDPGVQRAINERIAPVGQVAVSGENNSALDTPAPKVVAAVVDSQALRSSRRPAPLATLSALRVRQSMETSPHGHRALRKACRHFMNTPCTVSKATRVLCPLKVDAATFRTSRSRVALTT